MKTRDQILREANRTKKMLDAMPGTPVTDPSTAEAYGAWCALEWALGRDVARPSTIASETVGKVGMTVAEAGRRILAGASKGEPSK